MMARIFGAKFGKGGQESVGILARAALPAFGARLAAERLRFAGQLAQAPLCGWAAAASQGGREWQAAVCDDLDLLQAVLPEKVGHLPSARESPGEWERLWVTQPGPWKQLIALFLKRSAQVVAASAKLPQCVPEGVPNSVPDFRCEACPKSCASGRAL